MTKHLPTHLLLLISLCCLGPLHANSNPPHPEGLLLRGFESEAALNRRGDQAVLNGVATTVRVDAAGELSASISATDLAPLVDWYREREQYYSAYATFSPGIDSSIGATSEISAAGKTLDLDGNEASPSIFLDETYQAILTVAKSYVDAGVDAIHYDTAWSALDAGPFDPAAMSDFRDWLNARYSEATLQSYIDPSYDKNTFDYGAFLRSKGVTTANYGTATINSVKLGATKHWRLWHAFLRYREREVVAALVDAVNTYAQSELGREIGFYFNRYGFIDRPADRWFLAEYASGDLGETHFSGQSWEYADGHNLEPVFRANLKTNDNRFEPWNAPPAVNTAVQSLFLAETIANNGVATWEDDYPATAPIARLANQYQSQLDHTPVSEAAIFYPLATALHTKPLQVGPDPGLLGGDHYWYLGLGYILQDLEINYDVAFGGDGLGMPDTFSASDISAYPVVFASEAIQVTDNQFTALMDYVNGGGTLIVSGSNCFRYDALGNDMSSSRSYNSKTWTQLFGAIANTTIGSGTLKVVSLDPWGSTGYTDQPSSASLTTALAGFTAALPSDLGQVTNDASGDVRILHYLDASDNSGVYHLLNYSFNGAGTTVTTQSNFTVSFPTPSYFPSPNDYEGTPVATYVATADSAPTTLTITDLGNGTSHVTIPSLSYWGILRVGSAIPTVDHPNIEPIAYFDSLFSYEVFNSTATRSLTYNAFDDDEIDQLQIYYSKKDTGTGLFGPWTAHQIIAGTGEKEISDATVEYTLPSEGHFRLQIVATDSDSATNTLLGSGAYDTEVGYDSSAMDRSALVVTPLHGNTSGSVVTTPLTPSFSFTGHQDPVSGLNQYQWLWMNGGNTVDSGAGALTDTVTLDTLPAIVDGEYGRYSFTLRFQNGAQIWDESEEEYFLIYTVPPTYTGSETDEDTTSGASVNFNLEYTNVYGDVSIQWYKDDVAIDNETSDTLTLNNVSDSENGTYHATITNPAGQTTSTDFNLTVTTPLEVTQQPAGAQIDEGDPFSVTVEARGTGTLSYQWMLEGVDIDGATSQTYSIETSVRATHNGHYRVRITDDLTSIESNGAFVQISGGGGSGGGGSNTGTPTAPNNLAASDNGSNAVTLSWQDTANNETGFALERRQQGSNNWVSVSSGIPANDTQFIDATDIGSDTYEYRIKATSNSGDSSYSNIAAVSRSNGPGPLAAPTSLSASDNTAHVRLEWTDNATSETGYTIERKLQSDSSWSIVANIGANSNAFTDPINIGANAYEYRVKAKDANNSSDYSNVAAVSRSGEGGGGSEPTTPTAPATLAASDGDTHVTLTWDDLSNNETAFSLERREQGSNTWVSVSGGIPANTTQFIDATNIGTTTYEYRIQAIGASSNSDFSNTATVKRAVEEPTPPIAPANLAAMDGTTHVTLTWDDLSSDESGFSIQRRKQGAQTWTQVTTTAANTESYQDDIDIGGDTYEYRVAADKDQTASEPSNTATVKRAVEEPTPPIAPANLAAVDGTTHVTLTWDDLSSDESGFSIQRRKQGAQTWTQVTTTAANTESYQDDIDIGADTYEYRVAADKDQTASEPSNTATVKRAVEEPTPPIAPANLAAMDGTTHVTLTWDDLSSDESGFSIQRRKQGAQTWTQVTTTAANTESYQDDIDIGADTYEYRVAADKDQTASEPSNTATVKRAVEEPTPPIAPANLAAMDGTTHVTLTWDDLSSDESGFSIQRRKQGAQTWTQVTTTAANTESYQDDIDIGADTYEYRVAADKDQTASEPSNTATVKRAVTGTEISIQAILTGPGHLSLDLTDTDTVQQLRDNLASELEVSGDTLKIHLGQTELTELSSTLADAGFSDGDQFTVTRIGDSADTDYVNWSLANLGDRRAGRLPTEDANNDGVANLLHYAFGSSPTEVDFAANRFRIESNGENLTLSYQSNQNAHSIEIEIERFDPETQTWQTLVPSSESKTTADTDQENIGIVTITHDLPSSGPLIFRIKSQLQ